MGNWVLEAVEASEVAEAAVVNEAGKVLRPRNSLLWTSKSFRFLNSIILGLLPLYIDVLTKIRIMKTQAEF